MSPLPSHPSLHERDEATNLNACCICCMICICVPGLILESISMSTTSDGSKNAKERTIPLEEAYSFFSVWTVVNSPRKRLCHPRDLRRQLTTRRCNSGKIRGGMPFEGRCPSLDDAAAAEEGRESVGTKFVFRHRWKAVIPRQQ